MKVEFLIPPQHYAKLWFRKISVRCYVQSCGEPTALLCSSLDEQASNHFCYLNSVFTAEVKFLPNLKIIFTVFNPYPANVENMVIF